MNPKRFKLTEEEQETLKNTVSKVDHLFIKAIKAKIKETDKVKQDDPNWVIKRAMKDGSISTLEWFLGAFEES